MDFLLFGYDQGVTGSLLTLQSFNKHFPTINPQAPGISLAEGSKRATDQGITVASYNLGCFAGKRTCVQVWEADFKGAVACIWLGNLLGRKKTILLGALIFILGGGLQTGAQNLGYLYAGRAIAGLGVGFLVMIIPLYQAELAHPDIRGRVTALQQFMLGVGALVASWVSYATYTYFPDSSSHQWRVSLGIQVIPAGFLAMLIMFFPESPRYVRECWWAVSAIANNDQVAHRSWPCRGRAPNARKAAFSRRYFELLGCR